MSKTANIKLPKELTDIVKIEDVEVLGHGDVEEYEDKPGTYGLYRSVSSEHGVQLFDVSKDYLDQRSIKAGDKVAFVMYPLKNGRKVIDTFKLNE
ncbi:hypothetical protein KY345_02095 [Candidatus Woesearchaeota archaeon]|nr:hypothetical protein [Candidatus Woesearchaeota archaeon]